MLTTASVHPALWARLHAARRFPGLARGARCAAHSFLEPGEGARARAMSYVADCPPWAAHYISDAVFEGVLLHMTWYGDLSLFAGGVLTFFEPT